MRTFRSASQVSTELDRSLRSASRASIEFDRCCRRASTELDRLRRSASQGFDKIRSNVPQRVAQLWVDAAAARHRAWMEFDRRCRSASQNHRSNSIEVGRSASPDHTRPASIAGPAARAWDGREPLGAARQKDRSNSIEWVKGRRGGGLPRANGAACDAGRQAAAGSRTSFSRSRRTFRAWFTNSRPFTEASSRATSFMSGVSRSAPFDR